MSGGKLGPCRARLGRDARLDADEAALTAAPVPSHQAESPGRSVTSGRERHRRSASGGNGSATAARY